MRIINTALLASLAAAAAPAGAESTNQWYLRGPEGGYAPQVAIDRVSLRPLAGGTAGMFSYDGGAGAWVYANTGAPTPSVGAIVTTATATFANSGGYVARSTDGGATWTNVGDPAMGPYVSALATSPNAPNRIYAAVDTGVNAPDGGLWVSDNLGSTWTQRAITAGANLRLVRASPTNANLVFVAGNPDANGIAPLFRSTDGGVTFGNPTPTPVLQSGGTVNLPLQFVDVAQDPFNANRIVALTAPPPEALTDKSQGGQAFVSFDAGVTWDPPSTDIFVLAPETVGGGEPRAVVFDKITQNVIYFATSWGLFKSFNAPPVLLNSGMLHMGARAISGAQPNDEVDSVAQAADGVLYAGTTSGGVYRSTDAGANWAPLSAGYTGYNARIFAFQPGNTGVVLAGTADFSNIGFVYRSTDNGATWTRSSSGLDASVVRGLAFSPSNANLVIAGAFLQSGVGGADSRGIWRSTDAGVTWNVINDSGLRFNNKRIVAFDPNDGNKVLVTAPTRINLSSDGGVTWVNSVNASGLFGGLPFANNPDLTLLGLAAGPKPGGGTRFYIGITRNSAPGNPLPTVCQNDGTLPCKGGIYYSDDGGFHWTRATGVTDDSAWYVSVGATPGTVFVGQSTNAGYAGGVFKSTDYGVTWASSSTGLTCRNMYSVIATDPVDGNVAWTACNFADAAHPGGVFRSNDGGASWVPYGRGLRNPSILWMTVDPADGGHVLAGGEEGVHEMHFAPDSDQDGIPDSEEAAIALNGDANLDSIPDATQANVASTTIAAPFAPARRSTATAAGGYVVVEVQNAAAVDNGQCQFVSDLVVVANDEIAASNRMIQAAPTVRFILPNCQQATVKIRYSAVTTYPVGVFGSYSPAVAGDASTIRWGLLAPAAASPAVDGTWTLHLDENSYGNVYAPGTGSILFQGAPGTDSIFAGGFD